LKSYIIISLGLVVYAFAWICILAPAQVVGGGASGIALIIQEALGVPMGLGFLILNVILLGIALVLIGPRFGIKTIYAILFISLVMSVIQQIIPADLLGLKDDKLLSAILGGALCGVGVTLCLLQGGSSGGTDIVAMIITKFFNVSMGRVYMISDMIIIGSSFFVFDLDAIIYGYIMVGVFSYTVDWMMAGPKQSMQLFIITKNPDLLAEQISVNLKRGVTVLNGEGWYTKEPVRVLMVVCRRVQVSSLHRLINSVDKDAFVTTSAVTSVYGRGFEYMKFKSNETPKEVK
jgi:uncharacterized membrane-anchored protein YitT (DUF2179 family)